MRLTLRGDADCVPRAGASPSFAKEVYDFGIDVVALYARAEPGETDTPVHEGIRRLAKTAEQLKAAAARGKARKFALDAQIAGIDAKTLRELAETWSGRGPDLDRAKKLKEMMEVLPPKHQALVKEYLDRLEKMQP